ncbi:hypothetical protein BJ165DRAFT_1397577 [Panaeolus papilionaceus]|nr:hypothetical protein BJ165DRAFT_1397577 [Panaeolus papilionaceus]
MSDSPFTYEELMGIQNLWNEKHKVKGGFVDLRTNFLFVLDGVRRPTFKQGSQVRHHNWWTTIVQEIICSFGFSVHHAPEAEAELSMLNQIGMIDAVMTSDSNTALDSHQEEYFFLLFLMEVTMVKEMQQETGNTVPLPYGVPRIRGCQKETLWIYGVERGYNDEAPIGMQAITKALQISQRYRKMENYLQQV